MEISGISVLTTAKRLKPGLFKHLRNFPVLAAAAVLVFVMTALFGQFFMPANPVESSLPNKNTPPGGQYLLGSDYLGRDVLSRLIAGSRTSLAVASVAILVGVGAGTLLGLVSGYYGGVVDVVLMRFCDAMISFPSVIFAMLLGIALGPGFSSVVFAIGLSMWPRYTKVTRGEVLNIKNQNYIMQSKIINVPDILIILRHILPNLFGMLIVMLVQDIGHSILTESSLSYLGLSVQPPNPTWGSMVAEGRNTFSVAWWVCIFPSVAIVFTVMSFNSLGEWLKKKLSGERGAFCR
jgi:peptide/nickel transport system permease protein